MCHPFPRTVAGGKFTAGVRWLKFWSVCGRSSSGLVWDIYVFPKLFLHRSRNRPTAVPEWSRQNRFWRIVSLHQVKVRDSPRASDFYLWPTAIVSVCSTIIVTCDNDFLAHSIKSLCLFPSFSLSLVPAGSFSSGWDVTGYILWFHSVLPVIRPYWSFQRFMTLCQKFTYSFHLHNSDTYKIITS